VVNGDSYTVSILLGNGDGIPDLAVTIYDKNTVAVLFGRGDGTFHAPVNYLTGTGRYPSLWVSRRQLCGPRGFQWGRKD